MQVERRERDLRSPAGPPRGREVQRVERPRPRQLRDVGGRVARDGIELDDRKGRDVLRECRFGGRGVTLAEQPCEVAANLDDRVTRGQQRSVAGQQRIGRAGVGLVDEGLSSTLEST